MRKHLLISVLIPTMVMGTMPVESFGRGGLRGGGGGGGGRSRPSRSVSRPSGGSRGNFSGGFSRPSTSRPSSRPSTSRPSISRPSTGSRPSLGGGSSRPSLGSGNRPSLGGGSSRPSTGSGNRPSLGGGSSRPSLGGGSTRPGGGTTRPGGGIGIGDRPSIGTGNRPSIGDRPSTRPGIGSGIGDRPSTLPSTRPGIGNGDRPGIGDRPSTLPGNRPGIGDGNRPGIGDGNRPGIGDGNRPGIGDRPSTLPENRPGNRPGIGDRPGIGNRPGNRPGIGNGNIGNGNRPNIGNGNIGNGNIGNGNINIGNGNRWNGSRDRYNNIHINNYNHHGGWYHGYWHGHAHNRPWYSNPVAWGLGMWGLGYVTASWGYSSYSNPYYVASAPTTVIVEQSVSQPVYDYSQPIAVNTDADTAPPVDDTAMSSFEVAREKFKAGDYKAALTGVDQSIQKMPNDAALHEFRALCLFALGEYTPAAGTLYAVLSVGPGWDWTTMISLYPNAEIYTTQLRALETYRKEHPDSPDPAFVLAYQYMTCGHTDSAIKQLQHVLTLLPNDQVSIQLLGMLGGEIPESVKANAPKPVESKVELTVADLEDSWTSKREDETIQLVLAKEGKFKWTYTKGSEPRSFEGTYTYDNDVLTLIPTGGGAPMVAQLTFPSKDSMNFLLVGGSPTDPGLTFDRS